MSGRRCAENPYRPILPAPRGGGPPLQAVVEGHGHGRAIGGNATAPPDRHPGEGWESPYGSKRAGTKQKIPACVGMTEVGWAGMPPINGGNAASR